MEERGVLWWLSRDGGRIAARQVASPVPQQERINLRYRRIPLSDSRPESGDQCGDEHRPEASPRSYGRSAVSPWSNIIARDVIGATKLSNRE